MPRNHCTPKHSKNFQLALQNYTKSLFENNCFMVIHVQRLKKQTNKNKQQQTTTKKANKTKQKNNHCDIFLFKQTVTNLRVGD